MIKQGELDSPVPTSARARAMIKQGGLESPVPTSARAPGFERRRARAPCAAPVSAAFPAAVPAPGTLWLQAARLLVIILRLHISDVVRGMQAQQERHSHVLSHVQISPSGLEETDGLFLEHFVDVFPGHLYYTHDSKDMAETASVSDLTFPCRHKPSNEVED